MHDRLHLRKVCASWVPYLLAEEPHILSKDTKAVHCDSRVISNLLTEEGTCGCTWLDHREVQIFSSRIEKYCLSSYRFMPVLLKLNRCFGWRCECDLFTILRFLQVELGHFSGVIPKVNR